MATVMSDKRQAQIPLVPFMDRVNKEDNFFSDYRVKFFGSKSPIVLDNGMWSIMQATTK